MVRVLGKQWNSGIGRSLKPHTQNIGMKDEVDDSIDIADGFRISNIEEYKQLEQAAGAQRDDAQGNDPSERSSLTGGEAGGAQNPLPHANSKEQGLLSPETGTC